MLGPQALRLKALLVTVNEAAELDGASSKTPVVAVTPSHPHEATACFKPMELSNPIVHLPVVFYLS